MEIEEIAEPISIGRGTYEPSSHSGSTKLPPPLTPGSQDFLAAAATTTNFRGAATAPPTDLAGIGAENRAWLFLLPDNKREPNPFSTAADVVAISVSLSCSLPRSLSYNIR